MKDRGTHATGADRDGAAPAVRQGRCGFAAVIGPPNAGKSTLVNRMVGAKVSIVTAKMQTTRFRVLGIAIHGDAQIILIDTPGIFSPRKRLERAMVAAAWSGAADADEIVVTIDCRRGEDAESEKIVTRLRQSGRRAVLVLNKIDLIDKPRLLRLTKTFNEAGVFSDVFMVSALKGEGVGDLLGRLAGAMAEGPWLYPEDQISDLSDRVFANEITREKLFMALGQELPYAITVDTESWTARKDGSIEIRQIVNVQRDSQKGIVIGHKGSRLGSVGTAARTELEQLFGCRVHLFLFVKVQERWSEDPERYRDFGLDFEA